MVVSIFNFKEYTATTYMHLYTIISSKLYKTQCLQDRSERRESEDQAASDLLTLLLPDLRAFQREDLTFCCRHKQVQIF